MRLIDAEELKQLYAPMRGSSNVEMRSLADFFDGLIDRVKTYNTAVETEREKIDLNIYDEEEIHENCTVQILTNTKTGAVSVGWWENNENRSG